MISLAQLNSMPAMEAEQAFEKCCGTKAWCREMASSRPFSHPTALYETADKIWNSLSPFDWKEAFSHHPRIGTVEDLQKKFPETAAWAGDEQKGVAQASSDVLSRLAKGNESYEARYGHIFLVCATGKSASEMLLILESRMGNSPEAELKIAAEEQSKITRIRLEKMIHE